MSRTSWLVLGALPILLSACDSSVPATGAAGASARDPRAPDFHYDIPVQADSPWPEFRHDRYNTGNAAVAGVYNGDRPWAFRTGKGIFSPPIVDRDGTAYVGSADQNFYA